MRIELVDCHLQAVDAQRGAQRQPVGHDVYRSVGAALEDTAARRCQRHVAGGAHLGGRRVARIGGVAVAVAVDPRRVGRAGQVDTRDNAAHEDVTRRLDAQVVGVVIRCQHQADEIDDALGREREVAVGHAAVADRKARAALGEAHVTCPLGLDNQGGHLGAQVDQARASSHTLLSGHHGELIGLNLGASELGHAAGGAQFDIATAGAPERAHAHRGRRDGGCRIGLEDDVVGVTRAQRARLLHLQRAIVGNADRAVVGLSQRDGQRGGRHAGLVDHADVARPSQFGAIYRRHPGLQRDACLGDDAQALGTHEAVDDVHCAVVGGVGGSAGVGDAARGLRHLPRLRLQHHRLARAWGGERALVEPDVSAEIAGLEGQRAGLGGQRRVAVGTYSAVPGAVVACGHGHCTCGDGSTEHDVAAGLQGRGRQRRAGVGAQHAAQLELTTGAQGHRGSCLQHPTDRRLGAQQRHRIVGAQRPSRFQVEDVGLQLGGELPGLGTGRGGLAAELEQLPGVNAQRAGGRHLAADRHVLARIDDDVAASERALVAAAAASEGILVADLGDDLGARAVDRPLLPDRDLLHLLDLDLLHAGLPDRPVVVDVARLGREVVVQLDARVEQVDRLGRPVVTVVLEVLVAVAVGLVTADFVVPIVAVLGFEIGDVSKYL